MDNGWIKLHRRIQDNFLWCSEPFTKAQARIDLILLANHKPGTFFIRNIRVDVERGQLGYSQESLAKRWKWSRGKIIRFLKMLENEGQIGQQTGQQTGQQKSKVITIITIKNYDAYQSENIKNDTTDDTTNEQQTDINNNDNNVKNVKKEKKEDFYFGFGFSNTITNLISEYDKGRKRKLNKLTAKGLELWKRDLIKYGNGDDEQMALVLERSIANGWEGIFELDKKKQPPKDRRENPDNLTEIELGQLWFNARNGNKAAIEYIKNHGLKDKIGEDKFKEYKKLYINNLLQGTQKTS